MAEFATAVVIGKFCPPHRGHKLLIDTALRQSHHVTVLVCAKPSDAFPGPVRRRWLQEIHPRASVMLIDDTYDENDTAVWAANTIQWLGAAPEAVFSSEDYGDRYAKAMGARHIMVDRARIQIPCSATAVRRDPKGMWEYLEPPVREWLARRVIVVGAESTGTTTLAEALATRYQTTWVREYGREYSHAKARRGETRWTSDEFVHIANEQNARENAAARLANRVVFGDTNAWATQLWHRRYLGHESPAVADVAKQCVSDLYLLTGDEIPFVQDGLRDGEHIRHEMHRWFETALRSQEVPWRLVRGTPDQRLEAAAQEVDRLLRQPWVHGKRMDLK